MEGPCLSPNHSRSHRTDGLMPLQIAKIGVGGGKEAEITRGLVPGEHHEIGGVALITRRSQVQILPPPPTRRPGNTAFPGLCRSGGATLSRGRGMAQRELAERVGLAEQAIQRYEAGDYVGVGFGRLVDIADALQLTTHYDVPLASAG